MKAFGSFLLICQLCLCLFQTPSWAISTHPEWLADLRQKGLVMTEDDLKQLRTDPTSHKELKTKIAKQYSLILEAISTRKRKLKSLYQKGKKGCSSATTLIMEHDQI